MRYLIIATLFLGLTACEKNKLAQKIEDSPEGTAYVKLGYFAQYSNVTNVGVQMKIDSVRVSSLVTSPTPYPGGGFNTGGNSYADYLSMEPGTRNLVLSVPKVGTNTDSLVRFNGPVNLTEGIRQTIMITDTGANMAATVIADDITPPSPGTVAKGKFFNGIPGTNIDFYMRTPSGVIAPAKNIAYKSVSGYFEFTAGIGNDTLDIVLAGSPYTSATSPVLARYIWLAGNIIPGRVYTILSAGYNGLPSTGTDNRRPRVSVVLNR